MQVNNKKKMFKHQLLITAITVFSIVISMIGGSYALFSSTSRQDEYNMLKVGNLEMSYVDTGDGYGDILSLNGSYPVSDSEGSQGKPYRFNITNTGNITADFKIKILYDESIIEEDGCKENLLSKSFIKYKLDNNEPVLLSSKEEEDYMIYSSKNLLPNSSEIHEIRIWIDENATNEVLGKHFHGKVVIESTQGGVDDNLKQEYKIGQSITLKDNSKWHVLEDSGSNNATITLLSDYNLTETADYNDSCNGICNPYFFDKENHRLTTSNPYCTETEFGCNQYQQNGSTVTTDSDIKIWLENNYSLKLKNSLSNNGGNTEGLYITLPTMEQLAIADDQTFVQKTIQFNSGWITTTNYWTRTPSKINNSYVWAVNSQNKNSYVQYANNSTDFGIRPVITISKQNIK